uniref:Uncharacterized protein n=1 Tax=Caenorhabditis tropicalis TaxID=1561998 RepID=A0A1I7UYU3_9PELO
MRKKSTLTACCFLFFICTVINAHVPTIDELLRTNQYILISQQDSVTTIQRDVSAGRCPLFMSKITKDHSQLRFIGAHLIRDTFGRLPPEIMLITDNSYSFNVNIFSLNMTSIFEPTSRKSFKLFDKELFNLSKGIRNFKIKRRIKGTLFDSTSHLLYVDISTDDSFEMEQYYFTKLQTAEYQLTHIRNYHRTSPNSRFDWQEDHYAGKFYYKERVDDEIALFEIPMSAFIPTIWEGEAGVKIGVIQANGTLMGASGGMFYTVGTETNIKTGVLSTSLIPASLMGGFECQAKVEPASLPKFNKLIIVRNDDYCMLKYGADYNQKRCEEEQKDFLASKSFGDEPTDIVKWLLIICIVLFMFIILLFVYIFWLRSNFTTDFDGSHQNEYETEASLFVAKQRSFPSVYQDPALLDVSVDRWN